MGWGTDIIENPGRQCQVKISLHSLIVHNMISNYVASGEARYKAYRGKYYYACYIL